MQALLAPTCTACWATGSARPSSTARPKNGSESSVGAAAGAAPPPPLSSPPRRRRYRRRPPAAAAAPRPTKTACCPSRRRRGLPASWAAGAPAGAGCTPWSGLCCAGRTGRPARLARRGTGRREPCMRARWRLTGGGGGRRAGRHDCGANSTGPKGGLAMLLSADPQTVGLQCCTTPLHHYTNYRWPQCAILVLNRAGTVQSAPA